MIETDSKELLTSESEFEVYLIDFGLAKSDNQTISAKGNERY